MPKATIKFGEFEIDRDEDGGFYVKSTSYRGDTTTTRRYEIATLDEVLDAARKFYE